MNDTPPLIVKVFPIANNITAVMGLFYILSLTSKREKLSCSKS